MGALCLTRRRVQLDLLAELCDRRQRARIAFDGNATPNQSIETRFLEFGDSALYMAWPAVGVSEPLRTGADVHVFFETNGERLAFSAVTAGRTISTRGPQGAVSAWALSIPLCIERRQQREYYRVSLADLGPVNVRFTSVQDPEHQFDASLTNVSGGGLGCAAAADQAVGAQPRQLYWTRFALPEDDATFEFVVQLVHARRVAPGESVVLGCMFQPGDDPTTYREQLRRIEHFVANRQRAKLGRAHLHGGGI